MKGSLQVVKGRIEEAAGALSDNARLRSKGRTDQAVGQVRKAGEKGISQAKKAARQMVGQAKAVAKVALEDVKRR